MHLKANEIIKFEDIYFWLYISLVGSITFLYGLQFNMNNMNKIIEMIKA